MLRSIYIVIITTVLSAGFAITASAQSGALNRIKSLGSGAGGGKMDSVAHRTGLEDSITINFRFLDSSRLRGFDSSIYDFTRKVPMPWTEVNLGNFGTASRSLVFRPTMNDGWDHGFHAFDIYNFTAADSRFFNTTRPYTEMNYLLGSKSEQMINILHTQNIRPNWNFSFQYRLINSPGSFQNQNTNHNNYRFTSWYQSKNKRYQNFLVLVGNKLQSGESGGIKNDISYLDSIEYKERFSIPSQLGKEQTTSRNFFTTNITTGTYFTNATFLFRQQYDLGQKDSIITDSSVIPLFYPRLRLEHTVSYNTWKYRFRDYYADSTYYFDNYKIQLGTTTDTFFIQDYWKELVNDFSIYQFPDAKNAQQFIKVGATLQNLSGSFDSGQVNTREYNLFLHGEYRNRTRNKKWDIEANGNFYVSGYNSGDYQAYISLKRVLSKKLGSLQVGFRNTNRTPSYVYNQTSSFYLPEAVSDTFNKENVTNIFAAIEVPRIRFRLSGSYYLVSNLTYFSSYYQPSQWSTLFNLLEVSAEKVFRLGRKGWNWKTWLILQQRAGNGPVNVPLLTTRNTIGYDGKLGFKNLDISFGLEGKYFTPYKAANYSPLLGQFFYQDSANVKLHMPDISAYMHFRIKSFNAYVRAENLNTFNFSEGGFTKNNIPTLNYPYPGLMIRVGIFWSFVN